MGTPQGKPGIGESLIAATAELLEQRPLTAITVKDILERASVSRTSFYFYFASKEAAASALLMRVGTEAGAGFEAVWNRRDPRNPRDAIRGQLSVLFDTWEEHTNLLVAAQEAGPDDGELHTVWLGFMDAFVERYAQYIHDEREAGRAIDGPDAHALSSAMVWMDERAVHEHFTREVAPDRDVMIDALTHIWMCALYGVSQMDAQLAPSD